MQLYFGQLAKSFLEGAIGFGLSQFHWKADLFAVRLQAQLSPDSDGFDG